MKMGGNRKEKELSYYHVRCDSEVDFRWGSIQFPGQRAQGGIVYVCGQRAEKVEK